MNENYIMILQIVSLLMMVLLTGYFVLPQLSRPRIIVPTVVLRTFEKVQYEKNQNLRIRDFMVFEKYQIWRYTQRRKAALVLLEK